jgi:hypothetical protein
MDTTPKQAWTHPSVTPLTDSGSRSDAPDVAVRNGGPQSPVGVPA